MRKLFFMLAFLPMMTIQASAADIAGQSESTKEARATQGGQNSLVGKKFLDVQEADTDGKLRRLSSYAGRGKWVLVDFWASWCGPCRREMPNVVAAYRKYHKKGFEIVGLSFDVKKSDWVDAIKAWDMPWIHLSDLKGWESEAGRVYGVSGIPDNVLVDPEGIIVARGLRGPQLEEFLSKVIK